ncbi:MAG: hypothetical protein H7Y20_06835, partial [Bryobacteraceae bacterium]|nr:hypothetical protein [Bryobacteraceae bacterium]
ERTAYRIAGIETLTQTVPDGMRTGRDLRGGYTRLPGYSRTLVSEYGFVSLDAPGGAVKEVRRVLTIDGQKWSKQSRSLRSLAREMTAMDRKDRQKTLERFEDYGLTGFVTDLGQLILLFARGGIARYEFHFEKIDGDGHAEFSYQQLDGSEALTIYGETKEPVRQKLHGRIWVNRLTLLPLRISIESDREYDNIPVRDLSIVEYSPSKFGSLLPARIVHRQHLSGKLVVTDEFTYSGFHQVLGGGRP